MMDGRACRQAWHVCRAAKAQGLCNGGQLLGLPRPREDQTHQAPNRHAHFARGFSKGRPLVRLSGVFLYRCFDAGARFRQILRGHRRDEFHLGVGGQEPWFC